MTGLAQRIRSANLFDRQRFAALADGLAIALAVSLPWSTSAASIFAMLWLAAMIPTLDAPSLRRVVSMPAGGLPVLLCALAVVGMLWSTEVTVVERWDGLKPFLKLLYIPILMVQFSRSRRGSWVMMGFLISCSVLLATSWILVLRWALSPDLRIFPVQLFGMPVRDYIAQSGEFTICIFLLAKLALDDWRARHRRQVVCYLLLAAAFLANILYVSVSRTTLVILPVLLCIFACKQLPRKGMIGVLLAGVAVGALAWPLAPLVRTNITNLFSEVKDFRPEDRTRAGYRIGFWQRSIEFVAAAPVIGHGTGSMRELFRRAAAGQSGAAGDLATNPHNQTFAVAIQLGLLGTAVLFAFWLAHLKLFRSESLVAWAGLLIVTQNILASLFNSHLFDFTQGWTYVIGVGVAGGMVLKRAAAPRP